MVRLLAKLFIGAPPENASGAVRLKYGVLCGACGIFFNLLLAAAKLFAGLVSGSVAMVADALNNASDMLSSLVTAVGFQDRYLDLMETVKAELPKHKAGGLVYGAWVGGIPGVWWWQKKSDCGGQLVEQNIHLVDGLRWLYGEPLSVYATASRGIVKPGVDAQESYDTDDHSTAVFRFPNNVTATLVSGCYAKGVRPRCGLYIVLDDMILDYRLRNNLIITTADGQTDTPRGVDQTYLLDRAFIDAVRAGDPAAVRSPYSDALKSLTVAFAANRSMETGEVIYF